MAYLLLFKYMFNCNETKDIIEKEYNIITKNKKINSDLFSSLINIDCNQEAWIKSIKVDKNLFLVPTRRITKSKNIYTELFNNKSLANSKNQTEINLMLYKEDIKQYGFKLTYEEYSKTISIVSIYSLVKKINYLIIQKSLETLLTYLEKNYYIKAFEINFDKKNKILTSIRKIGFKKQAEKDVNNSCKYVWNRIKKNIGKELILTAGPAISEKENFNAFLASKYGWNKKYNGFIADLENKFAKYIGVKYALATSSCTGALHIALTALGISKNDEVIVPDVSWIATARAVTYTNAKPVFADIEYDTWNINISSLLKCINKKTKAIIPVHMYGQPANILEIKKIAKKYNLYVIEDAAPAIGSKINDIKCGSTGDFSAFSFQGAKLLVAGEGGMLCTNNKKLFDKAKKISEQGRNPNYTFWIDGPGLKYKMSNIQAAIALAQLERVDELIYKKRRIFKWYKEYLQPKNNFILQEENSNSYSNYWMTNILITHKKYKRTNFIEYLRKYNIDSRPVFSPISEYPIWDRKLKAKRVSKLIGNNAINLPSGVTLTKEEIRYISTKINNYFSEC